MMRKIKERWKKIRFPKKFNTKQNYQISNYGRVKNLLKDGAFQIKKPLLYKGIAIYKFTFPAKENEGVRLQLHRKAHQLVAEYFSSDYETGCYVVWNDYNRLNNCITNLNCLQESEARSHIAKGRGKNYPQFEVFPDKETITPSDNNASILKVEQDDDFFKIMDQYPDYEINRSGIIRRSRDPFKGRIMKQRLHPSNYYFLDLIDKYKKRRTVYPHKEVAIHWNINIMPEEYTTVLHLDGDTLNNHSDNLEWVTGTTNLKGKSSSKTNGNINVNGHNKKNISKNGVKIKNPVLQNEMELG